MPNQIQEAKRALRQQVYEALRQIPAQARATASESARATLKAQPLWTRAQSILLFAPMPGELDVWPLLAEVLATGRQVLLPRFVAATRSYEACFIRNPAVDLHVGHFGIREPCSTCARAEVSRVDLILVPGVAFDLQGHRLGRGKGYYDLLLGTIRGTTCGVAFEEQIADEIPVEPHDVRLDYLLTPERWVQVQP